MELGTIFKPIQSIKVLLVAALMLVISGCSLEANISNITGNAPIIDTPDVNHHTTLDFVQAESITTGNGYKLRGSFGALPEKHTTGNGYTLENVFYE